MTGIFFSWTRAMDFKKIGAEAILISMLIPWMIWATTNIFSSQKVEAVQETKYQVIIEKINKISDHFGIIN